MDQVAFVSIGLTLTLPLFLYAVESAVRRRETTVPLAVPELN